MGVGDGLEWAYGTARHCLGWFLSFMFILLGRLPYVVETVMRSDKTWDWHLLHEFCYTVRNSTGAYYIVRDSTGGESIILLQLVPPGRTWVEESWCRGLLKFPFFCYHFLHLLVASLFVHWASLCKHGVFSPHRCIPFTSVFEDESLR